MGRKIYDLKERSFNFAQRILAIAEKLPKKFQVEILGNQLIKAGTSIGANIEEADGTLTKKDFINKMVIARKEAKETGYWLNLIHNKYLNHEEIAMDCKECRELVNILSAIINKSR